MKKVKFINVFKDMTLDNIKIEIHTKRNGIIRANKLNVILSVDTINLKMEDKIVYIPYKEVTMIVEFIK